MRHSVVPFSLVTLAIAGAFVACGGGRTQLLGDNLTTLGTGGAPGLAGSTSAGATAGATAGKGGVAGQGAVAGQGGVGGSAVSTGTGGQSATVAGTGGFAGVSVAGAAGSSSAGTAGSGNAGQGGAPPTTCQGANGITGCCYSSSKVEFWSSGLQQVDSRNCTNGTVCGWDATRNRYGCVMTPGADPSGAHPEACGADPNPTGCSSSSMGTGGSGAGGTGGVLGCASCVTQQCGTQINACLQDPNCLMGIQCIATMCLGGGGAMGGGPLGGALGGGGNFGCFLQCFGGNFQTVGEAISAVTCVTQQCGSTCGGAGGLLGGLGGGPAPAGGGVPLGGLGGGPPPAGAGPFAGSPAPGGVPASFSPESRVVNGIYIPLPEQVPGYPVFQQALEGNLNR